MKIKEVECLLFTSPYKSKDKPCLRSYGVVEITTEDGLKGYGEPYAAVNIPSVFKEIIHHLKPLLIDQDAEPMAILLKKLYRICEYFDHCGMVYCSIGAIDWAMHDLAAQRAQLPLHRYLNPSSSDSIELYASAGLHTQKPNQLQKEFDNYLEKEFRKTKIRAGGQSMDITKSTQHIHEVFKNIPSQMKVAVDMGQQIFWKKQWTYDQCLGLIKDLKSLDLLFLEDPLLINDFKSYCKLRSKSCVPIAGGEMFAKPEQFKHYIEGGAWDLVQPDAAVLPGPAASLKVGSYAQTHQLPVAMHGWAGPIAQMQNIHSALAITSCDLVEYCMLYHPFLHETMAPIWEFQNGRLKAPEYPGMSIKVEKPIIDKYPFQYVSSLIA